MSTVLHINSEIKNPASIKCVVWDLDGTLWSGTLLEGDMIKFDQRTLKIIEELDRRGILHCIASRNSQEHVLDHLERLGIRKYFLVLEIHWGSKAESLKRIAQTLNLGFEAFLFIDDNPAERAEVQFHHPEVFVLDAAEIPQLTTMPELMPRFVTPESASRRAMYQADLRRQKAQEDWSGPSEQFLATLNMNFQVRLATVDDLHRAEELVLRTNQLNSTGRTYSYDQIKEMLGDPSMRVLVCELDDVFGGYGTIGLSLLSIRDRAWHISLLLMSCRVASRGLGSLLLDIIIDAARRAEAILTADFVKTNRNRLMEVAYRFAGFRPSNEVDELRLERATDVKLPTHVLLNIRPEVFH